MKVLLTLLFAAASFAQPVTVLCGSPADRYFSANSGVFAMPAGVTPAYLRYGSSFSYDIPLTNGMYSISVIMAEPTYTAAGKRVFTVAAQGQVSGPIDLFALTGAVNTAYTLPMMALVGNNVLHLQFTALPGSINAVVGELFIVGASGGTALQGEVGPTGLQGIPGNTGATGATGPAGPGTGTGITGVPLSALPSCGLAIALPDGTFLPVSVVNGGTVTAPQPVPANCGPSSPAVAAFVNLTDPTGISANTAVALFSYYTAFPQFAVWSPVTLALFGNGTPSIPGAGATGATGQSWQLFGDSESSLTPWQSLVAAGFALPLAIDSEALWGTSCGDAVSAVTIPPVGPSGPLAGGLNVAGFYSRFRSLSVITLSCGANDFIDGVPAENTINLIKSWVALVGAFAPLSKIVVETVADRKEMSANGGYAWKATVNAAIRTIPGIAVADVGADPNLGCDGCAANGTYFVNSAALINCCGVHFMGSDGVPPDPTNAGVAIQASLMVAAMKNLGMK